MNRTVLLGILIYLLVLAGIASLNGALLALALPLVLYAGAALLWEQQDPQLRVERSLSATHVANGAPLLVSLRVTNEGTVLNRLLIEDLAPAGLTLREGDTRTLTTLAPGQTVTLEYTLQGPRGSYDFAGVRATASDQTGLMQKQVQLDVTARVFVLPDLLPLKQVQVRPRRTRIYSGQVPARVGGPGVEFFGVREYQPGDPLRWVNDRISARHDEALFVNEFEQERAADIGLILDVRRRSAVRVGDGQLLEQSVVATASLAHALLAGGNRVGLLMHGAGLDWVVPGYGKLQRERIVRALARAQPGDSPVFESLEELPTHLFPLHAQLVLISPLLSADLKPLMGLRARGRELVVVSPDPVRYEAQFFKRGPAVVLGTRAAALERALLLKRLQEAGVLVVDWNIDLPFHQVAQMALRRPPPLYRGANI